MTDLSDVIKALEDATEGSWELDWTIARAVGTLMQKKNSKGEVIFDHPRHSRSIDAAVSLVPEGWAWNLHDNGECSLWDDPKHVTVEIDGLGATPALGACIAALRARKEANNG